MYMGCRKVIRLFQKSLLIMARRDFHFHKEYTNRPVNLRVLLDMDGVLCDFEGDFLEAFKRKYPDEPHIELEDREGFWLREQYEKMKPGSTPLCSAIYNSRGFFQNLSEIPGAVDAAREMAILEGVDVFICTSPLNNYKYCLKEKFHWVEKHLGRNWCEKIILTKDKTMANGHLLIDDRPNISGANVSPSWEHVVFTSCHNRTTDIRGKRRLDNWTDGSWRDLIDDFKKRIG
ncbi:5'(3')-deoxyribonucleotidase, cytosolic type-like isoform X1 [Ruditapes philippinarum]|uniref:5'(3')-deoxyribonucleotidase, cytosolic type-like isoform X1 n=2 Tax=Ruditapes philippinarum TaxID=129788 RepID=UPI00295B5661|nr:5'(3')-deoxyribonucleotidase, cytosolic type-like isoform X1 [Ruditapes philippinarum]